MVALYDVKHIVDGETTVDRGKHKWRSEISTNPLGIVFHHKDQIDGGKSKFLGAKPVAGGRAAFDFS